MSEQGVVETDNLWLPGMSLDHEHSIPSMEELLEHWQDSHGHSGVVESPGVFGVLREPDILPIGFASIDLCEVIRESHISVARVVGKTLEDILDIHNYAETAGLQRGQETQVLQVLFSNDMITPIENALEIKDIIKSWRKVGVFCVANTSTLPGCELSTVDFLSNYFGDCFDGILFPRNHDGKGKTTKGLALRSVMEEFMDSEKDTFAVHIDDAPHHCSDVSSEVGGLIGAANLLTVMPVYPGEADIPPNTQSATNPLEAFRAAEAFISSRL